MSTATRDHIATCAALAQAIGKSRTVEEIYAAALDALRDGMGVERASILLFDPDGVMRFKAHRGLSDAYRRAVEGHSPWRPDTPDPQPIWVADVAAEGTLAAYQEVFAAENIRALAFIPLVSREGVIGKFMMYYPAPTATTAAQRQLAGVIAAQVAFAVERTRAEEQARRSEERLRFALDAAAMGTWDWDLVTNSVRWSDNLAAIHGLPDGAFDGSFASYEREIHPDDRERVFHSIQRALREGVPHDVEYRIVGPDGTVRWCEGKGRVESENGRPVRMSGVCMIVTRRKEAELARIAAAEESSRLKDEFLATLSHELRTPLNAILGWVQMLQQGRLPAERVPYAIDVISRNAALQSQLIEDILDVSRIIAGKLSLERGPVSMRQLLGTAIAGIAPALEEKRLVLQQDVAADLPTIEGDPKRLHQVLNNVLSNAVKFTPEGGTIVLACTADGDVLTLQVRDTGIGIAPAFIPFVFDRFRQADSHSTRSQGGLGLGLAIARHVVEQHGGTISAHSDGPGTGTTISIRLPVRAGATPGPGGDAAPAEWSGEPRLDGIRALVVGARTDSREMIAALLGHWGAAAVLCDSARAALAALEQSRIDVVVTDAMLTEVDGNELLTMLRAAGHRTPAIAVTEFARADDLRHAIECGFSGHLAKPVDGAALAQAVRRAVGASPV